MHFTKVARKAAKLRQAGFSQREIDFLELMAVPDEDIPFFLSEKFSWSRFFPSVNGPQQQVLNDKFITQKFLESLGVAMPTLIGLWHPSYGCTPSGEPLRTARELNALLAKRASNNDTMELIFKPRAGRLGKNVISVALQSDQKDFIVSQSGCAPLSLQDFIAGLTPDDHSHFGSQDQGWLVQERVTQHPEIAVLNPSSLNTVRITTYLTRSQGAPSRNGEAVTDFAFLRVGRAGSATDGWSEGGGLAINVDIADGTLGAGLFSKRPASSTQNHHPDSQVHFEGRRLPFWNDAKALCEQTALLFPDVRSIGWDVALTETGPLIVEGNAKWVPMMPQAFGGAYFTGERRDRLLRDGAVLP